MSVYVDDQDFTLYHGDALETLRTLAHGSVDCVATSPPFYGLRDYGMEGQIGLEATPDEWCANLVAVFQECRRVLADTGTLWCEIGDSYNAATSTSRAASTLEGSHGYWANPHIKLRTNAHGLKPKDLLGQPWLLAFALRADGWYLRQAIVWHKPNAMPESVTDRCTTAHSYIFLLSKKPRYHFDAEAISEPRVDGRKNARSVWTISTHGYSEGHFATFPEELVRRMILAGCPERVCRTCGKPSHRIVDKRPRMHAGDSGRTNAQGITQRGKREDGKAIGTVMRERFQAGYDIAESWSDCGHDDYRPGLILDPFMGSGTTALVARKHGRHSIGIELNESYCQLAARRLQQLSLLTDRAT